MLPPDTCCDKLTKCIDVVMCDTCELTAKVLNSEVSLLTSHSRSPSIDDTHISIDDNFDGRCEDFSESFTSGMDNLLLSGNKRDSRRYRKKIRDVRNSFYVGGNVIPRNINNAVPLLVDKWKTDIIKDPILDIEDPKSLIRDKINRDRLLASNEQREVTKNKIISKSRKNNTMKGLKTEYGEFGEIVYELRHKNSKELWKVGKYKRKHSKDDLKSFVINENQASVYISKCKLPSGDDIHTFISILEDESDSDYLEDLSNFEESTTWSDINDQRFNREYEYRSHLEDIMDLVFQDIRLSPYNFKFNHIRLDLYGFIDLDEHFNKRCVFPLGKVLPEWLTVPLDKVTINQNQGLVYDSQVTLSDLGGVLDLLTSVRILWSAFNAQNYIDIIAITYKLIKELNEYSTVSLMDIKSWYEYVVELFYQTFPKENEDSLDGFVNQSKTTIPKEDEDVFGMAATGRDAFKLLFSFIGGVDSDKLLDTPLMKSAFKVFSLSVLGPLLLVFGVFTNKKELSNWYNERVAPLLTNATVMVALITFLHQFFTNGIPFLLGKKSTTDLLKQDDAMVWVDKIQDYFVNSVEPQWLIKEGYKLNNITNFSHILCVEKLINEGTQHRRECVRMKNNLQERLVSKCINDLVAELKNVTSNYYGARPMPEPYAVMVHGESAHNKSLLCSIIWKELYKVLNPDEGEFSPDKVYQLPEANARYDNWTNSIRTLHADDVGRFFMSLDEDLIKHNIMQFINTNRVNIDAAALDSKGVHFSQITLATLASNHKSPQIRGVNTHPWAALRRLKLWIYIVKKPEYNSNIKPRTDYDIHYLMSNYLFIVEKIVLKDGKPHYENVKNSVQTLWNPNIVDGSDKTLESPNGMMTFDEFLTFIMLHAEEYINYQRRAVSRLVDYYGAPTCVKCNKTITLCPHRYDPVEESETAIIKSEEVPESKVTMDSIIDEARLMYKKIVTYDIPYKFEMDSIDTDQSLVTIDVVKVERVFDFFRNLADIVLEPIAFIICIGIYRILNYYQNIKGRAWFARKAMRFVVDYATDNEIEEYIDDKTNIAQIVKSVADRKLLYITRFYNKYNYKIRVLAGIFLSASLPYLLDRLYKMYNPKTVDVITKQSFNNLVTIVKSPNFVPDVSHGVNQGVVATKEQMEATNNINVTVGAGEFTEFSYEKKRNDPHVPRSFVRLKNMPPNKATSTVGILRHNLRHLKISTNTISHSNSFGLLIGRGFLLFDYHVLGELFMDSRVHKFSAEITSFDENDNALPDSTTVSFTLSDVVHDKKSDYALLRVGQSVFGVPDITNIFSDYNETELQGLLTIGVDMVSKYANLPTMTATYITESTATDTHPSGIVYTTRNPVFTKGMCGSIIYANYKNNIIILGLHQRGNAKNENVGQCTYLTKELLTKMMNNLGFSGLSVINDGVFNGVQQDESINQNQCSLNSSIHSLPKDAYYQYFGHANELKSRRKPSEFVKTPFNEYYPCSQDVPNLLNRVEGDKWINPMYPGLFSDTVGNFSYDCELVDTAIDDLLNDIHALPVKWSELKPFPLEVAISGLKGQIAPINLSTSSGTFLRGDKHKYVVPIDQTDNYYKVFKDELTKQHLNVWKRWDQGYSANFVFKTSVKDEPRKPSKAPRTFKAGPFDHTTQFRQFYGPFFEALRSQRKLSEHAIGVNCLDSEQWIGLVRCPHSFPFLELDRVGFDVNNIIIPRLLYKIACFIEKYCAYNKKALYYTYCLAYESVNYIRSYDGDLLKTKPDMPSGHSYTGDIQSMSESVFGRFQHWLCYQQYYKLNNDWITIAAKAPKFSATHAEKNFGDDDFDGINPSITYFYNPEQLEIAFKRMRLPTTSAKKDQPISFTTLDRITFLKRKFVFDNELKIWKCPIEENSIHKSLSFRNVQSPLLPVELAAINCRQALCEWWHYGRERYLLEYHKMMKVIPLIERDPMYSCLGALTKLPQYDEVTVMYKLGELIDVC